MTTYLYEKGAVRWRKNPPGDPRGYRPAKGWDAEAVLIDYHPLTGRPFRVSTWWIRETYNGA